MTEQNLYGKRFYKEKNIVGSKKVDNICLNYSVANTDRPTISKTNHLEENLNDANCVRMMQIMSFKKVKNAVMHFNQFTNTRCKTLRI